MKAFVINTEKNGIDKIEVKEIEKPSAGAGEVLIKVAAVPLSSWEREFASNDSKNELLEMMDGHTVNLGLEFSGIVESDGVHFKTGDRVVGSIDFVKEEKTMAEYIAVNEDYLAILPDTLSFIEGASLPVSSETAYTGLVELAEIKEGQAVLIIGANGGVGVYATQIAKLNGATVTTVGSTATMAKLKALGADKTYSYTETKLEDIEEKFDIIFDLAKTLKFKEAQHMLNVGGVFVNSNPQLDEEAESLSASTDKSVPYLFVAHGTTEILTKIVNLVDSKKIKPMVESIYPVADYQKAFESLVVGDRFGKIVIDFEEL